MLISDNCGLDADPTGSPRKQLICSPLKDIIFYRDAAGTQLRLRYSGYDTERDIIWKTNDEAPGLLWC